MGELCPLPKMITLSGAYAGAGVARMHRPAMMDAVNLLAPEVGLARACSAMRVRAAAFAQTSK